MKIKRSALPTLLLLAALLAGSMLFPQAGALAAEDAIPSMSIDVVLQADGSAIITEAWDVVNVNSGTEYYKKLHNLEGMRMHSLRVWDESSAEYEHRDNWDTSLSMQQKARQSGILQTDEGFEICWGIGSYGDHQYTIQYTVDGLVKSYGDSAGFYHQFIADPSSPPQTADVSITAAHAALTADNARIWAYGFTGEVRIKSDGSLAAYTTEAMGNSDYLNLLCRFDSALFPAAASAGMTFDELKNKADNASDGAGAVLGIALSLVGGVTALIVALGAFFSNRLKLADGTVARLPRKKNIAHELAAPFGGSVPAVYAAMRLMGRHVPATNLLGSYLIQLQKAGNISIEEVEKATRKKNSKEEAIKFNADKLPTGDIEKALYNMLLDISQDGVLTTSAIEKNAEQLGDELKAWADDIKAAGQQALARQGEAAQNSKGAYKFTQQGFQQATKLLGFQSYLSALRKQDNDFTAPREYWDDYLVFSTLFGMGEKVLGSLQAADPAHFETFSGYYGCNAYGMVHLMNMTSHVSASSSANIDGTGGAASSSGGGGFSGGGGSGTR